MEYFQSLFSSVFTNETDVINGTPVRFSHVGQTCFLGVKTGYQTLIWFFMMGVPLEISQAPLTKNHIGLFE
ncbi:hypothetical protein D3C81_2119800 [compost metagenome]